MFDCIPGGIHIATGDKERGEQILKGASTSTAAVIGGILGGPAGAIAAGAASDGLITGVDSAINKEYTPFGVIDYASNIHRTSAGDHFDQLLGIGSEFAGGKTVRGRKTKGGGVDAIKERGFGDTRIEGVVGEPEGSFGVDASKKRGFDAFEDSRIDGIVSEPEGVGSSVVEAPKKRQRDEKWHGDWRRLNLPSELVGMI